MLQMKILTLTNSVGVQRPHASNFLLASRWNGHVIVEQLTW